MKAAIYYRVSTDRQVQGHSPEGQLEELQAWADYKQWDVVAIENDNGLSGRKNTRPGYNRILEMVERQEVDVVMVYSLARFSRNTRDMLEALNLMAKKGVTFYSLTEEMNTSTAMGKFFVRMLASLAELESDLNSDRITTAHRRVREKGGWMGRVPFGYKLSGEKGDSDRQLIKDPEQQKAIKRMKWHHNNHGLAKKLSPAKIAKKMEAEGWLNGNGKCSWSRQIVEKILKAPNPL